jgi:hypothetical protein
MHSAFPHESHAFDTLGLKPYASAEEIDRQWRRQMLHAHPDKSRDDGRRAQEYNEARAVAKRFAQDPVQQAHRDAMRDTDRCRAERDRTLFLLRVRTLVHDECMRSDPSVYDPAELARLTQNWTPQQRQEAEDALRFGLDRRPLDDVLERLEALGAVAVETEAKANAMEAELERCKRRLEAETAQRKEWEAKCHALQERLDQNGEPPKKRRKPDEASLAAFLRTHIRADEGGFARSSRIRDAFTNHTKAQFDNQVFFKQLKLQLHALFPTATHGSQHRNHMHECGYHGITLLASTGRTTRAS